MEVLYKYIVQAQVTLADASDYFARFALQTDRKELIDHPLLPAKPAAVIIEPIQSMGGMRTADRSYFEALRAACDETGAMLIFDEVQTGVGRTGSFSYAQTIGVLRLRLRGVDPTIARPIVVQEMDTASPATCCARCNRSSAWAGLGTASNAT